WTLVRTSAYNASKEVLGWRHCPRVRRQYAEEHAMAETTSSVPSTMFEKIWRRHVVVDRPDGYTLLYIDRHLLHDGSYNAFRRLADNGLKIRHPERSFATPDHYMPTN